jgi:hypothetical protein
MAGLAALLIEAFPQRSVADLERAIFDSCRRPGGMSESRANRGIPDGVEALKRLEA